MVQVDALKRTSHGRMMEPELWITDRRLTAIHYHAPTTTVRHSLWK